MSFALPRHAVLLDDARREGRAFLFEGALEWIEAWTPDEALDALARIDAAVADGLWVAGAFAFELGYLLEPRLRPLYRASPDPLVAVGLYRARREVDGAAAFADLAAASTCTLGGMQPSQDLTRYRGAFERVRDYIAAGDTYQINLTFPLSWTIEGSPLRHAAQWRRRSGGGHIALVQADERLVLSFSPELFVAADGDGMIRTRPMKGTIARGTDAEGDDAARVALKADVKQRAENLMIVDLLRNDLSRICRPGSVRVTDLFTVETYPTLHTMTSGIVGEMEGGMTPSAVLRALFPCGSVTGAPKIRAMEIIAETEPASRGFYCGSIGYFGPGGVMDLNVAIRTLVHAPRRRTLRMGVGGGIVYDSKAEAEYDEALLKARFVTGAQDFELLETMRWEPEGGFRFLAEHLDRLERAATAFTVPLDRRAVVAALETHVGPLPRGSHRVRLRVDLGGRAVVESTPLALPFAEDGADAPVRMHVAVSTIVLATDDPVAAHKTTRRAPYEAALAEAKAAGADEAILLNQHGRVADGSFTTIFAARGGVLLTPPSSEGALDSVLKHHLKERGAPPVQEASLSLADLQGADALYVGNSVRGLLRAVLL